MSARRVVSVFILLLLLPACRWGPPAERFDIQRALFSALAQAAAAAPGQLRASPSVATGVADAVLLQNGGKLPGKVKLSVGSSTLRVAAGSNRGTLGVAGIVIVTDVGSLLPTKGSAPFETLQLSVPGAKVTSQYDSSLSAAWACAVTPERKNLKATLTLKKTKNQPAQTGAVYGLIRVPLQTVGLSTSAWLAGCAAAGSLLLRAGQATTAPWSLDR